MQVGGGGTRHGPLAACVSVSGVGGGGGGGGGWRLEVEVGGWMDYSWHFGKFCGTCVQFLAYSVRYSVWYI